MIISVRQLFFSNLFSMGPSVPTTLSVLKQDSEFENITKKLTKFLPLHLLLFTFLINFLQMLRQIKYGEKSASCLSFLSFL